MRRSASLLVASVLSLGFAAGLSASVTPIDFVDLRLVYGQAGSAVSTRVDGENETDDKWNDVHRTHLTLDAGVGVPAIPFIPGLLIGGGVTWDHRRNELLQVDSGILRGEGGTYVKMGPAALEFVAFYGTGRARFRDRLTDTAASGPVREYGGEVRLVASSGIAIAGVGLGGVRQKLDGSPTNAEIISRDFTYSAFVGLRF